MNRKRLIKSLGYSLGQMTMIAVLMGVVIGVITGGIALYESSMRVFFYVLFGIVVLAGMTTANYFEMKNEDE